MDIYHGIDIVSVDRIRAAIEQEGGRFVRRVFTPSERKYCETKRMKYEYYAARFAAKEAVIKAVGFKGKAISSFHDIEIKKKATGKPFVRLAKSYLKVLRMPSAYKIELSLAHERKYAIASALLIIP